MYSTTMQTLLVISFLGGLTIGWYSGVCYVGAWKNAYKEQQRELTECRRQLAGFTQN